MHIHSKHGFNLVESAIVLGVVGLVIGGIWAAAANVSYNMKIQQTEAGWLYYLSEISKLMDSKMAVAGSCAGPNCNMGPVMERMIVPAGWVGRRSDINNALTFAAIDPFGNRLQAQIVGVNPATGYIGGAVNIGYFYQSIDRNICSRVKFFMVSKANRLRPIYWTGWPGSCNSFNTNPAGASVGFYYDNCCDGSDGEVAAMFHLP